MSETAELMGGRGGMLTLHPDHGDQVEVLFVTQSLKDFGVADRVGEVCRAVRPEFDDGQHFWRIGCLGNNASVLLMPVDRVPGHGRLVVSIFFDSLTDEARARADRIYQERRPFAVGYFHLWQANRQLLQRAESLTKVLDQTAIGVLLLDRSAQIIFANQTAKDILAAHDGLTEHDRRPCASYPADGVNLRAALAHALTSTTLAPSD